MRIVINALAGLIFGLGLLISGMANPAKVQNFLDVAGTFDPSLIFVMIGAIVVTFLGYRFVFGRPRPILAERFSLPTRRKSMRKCLGAALFGIGWGLSGFCPAPQSPRFSCWPRAHSSLCPQCSLALAWHVSSSRRGRPAKPPPPKRAKPSEYLKSRRFSLSLDRRRVLLPETILG